MKYTIIGDVHLDSKDDMIDKKINLIKNILENNKNDIIFLGDFFHNRKHISVYALKQAQKILEDHKYNIYMIIGNHCATFKNTLYPNSLETSFRNISNVYIIDKPTELDNFLIIPWICDENYDECVNAIKTSSKKYLCGHLEITSFYMTNNIECRTGFKFSDLTKFNHVFSGHFHLSQDEKNISYIGNISQESWNDFNNSKRYCIIENDDIQFHSIGSDIYKKIFLDDDKTDFDIDEFKDCVIKLYHSKKLTKKQFDKIEELKSIVKSYQIFDESVNLNEVKIEQVEFKDMLKDFMKMQDFDYKVEIEEYLIEKHSEV